MRTSATHAFSFLLLLLTFGLATTSAAAQNGSAPSELFKVVDNMPLFPGCDELENGPYHEMKRCADQRMLEYIYGNVEYPQEAQEAKVEGMTVIQFIVEKDGTLSNAHILRNPGAGTGEEALRVVNKMNADGLRWRAGVQDGQPVRVTFNLPIKFKLQGETGE